MLDKDFKTIVIDLKKQISMTQLLIMSQANKQLVELYFKLGKTIGENYTYGEKFVDNLSIELKLEFPTIQGFSARNLNSMKKFYEEYKDDELLQQLVAKVPWGHNLALIEKIKDKKERQWYIEECIKSGWSRDVLKLQIKSDLYSRQVATNKLTNFNNTLPAVQSDLANQTIKDPYLFDFITLNKGFKERELENKLLEQIKNVLIELGTGFSFVGNQYKLSVNNKDYFIDLLFYHLKLRCYVVVELKVTEFEPEYAGKLNFYLTAIDDKLKTEQDNPTIGLILVQDKDKFTVEYSLNRVNSPIGVSSYEVNQIIPKEVLDNLPTEEDINLHIDIDDI